MGIRARRFPQSKILERTSEICAIFFGAKSDLPSSDLDQIIVGVHLAGAFQAFGETDRLPNLLFELIIAQIGSQILPFDKNVIDEDAGDMLPFIKFERVILVI